MEAEAKTQNPNARQLTRDGVRGHGEQPGSGTGGNRTNHELSARSTHGRHDGSEYDWVVRGD